MRSLLVALSMIFSLQVLAQPTTPTGIVLDTPWKMELQEFAVKNVVHAAWGYSHSERNYHNTKMIASLENITVDNDVLFAASFLHDLGGLPGFEKEGVDHGIRSAELGVPLLRSWGFPEEKLSAVEEVIIGHIYYGPRPSHPLARAFRDADILDFLGTIGVSRILAATHELGATPSIKNSVGTLQSMLEKLPPELFYATSKKESAVRVRETKAFLKSLEKYSFQGKAH